MIKLAEEMQNDKLVEIAVMQHQRSSAERISSENTLAVKRVKYTSCCISPVKAISYDNLS